MSLCKAAGCKKTALFNLEGEEPPLVCGQHRAEGMASPALVGPCTAHCWLASEIAQVCECCV